MVSGFEKFTGIPKRGARCCLCANVLNEGYYSSVEYIQREMRRTDYCSNCWEEDNPNEGKTEALWWHGVLSKKKKSPLSTEDNGYLELFEECYHTEERDEAFLYFLAHYLKRRGHIIRRCIGEHDGRSQEIFEERDGSGTYMIPKVDIDPQKLVEIKSMVANFHG